ncbi:membrane protein [Tenacibaculum sp. KUL152]|nr:membrane protein [Tenacibaculum sp. KUL152]GFD94610.1 membrane protein [Alteromonas sp. KUL154]GFE01620.1 membrane protein [Alteromonas sp. KUL156]
MPRKNTSFADLLFQAPWWVSVITATITYVIMSHVLPSVETDNQLINMVFKALAIPAPYFAIFILFIAPFSFFNARRKAKQLDAQKSIETIRQLHWRNFEELVAEAYRRQGYRVTEGGFGADGGIDLELRKDEELVLVQCKQWKAQKVGVSVVREMFGVLTASNANKVIVICSGKFTQQAIDFASDKPVTLIDGNELLSLINEVQTEPKVEAINQNVCPRCGSELVERQAKRGANAGNAFLGCSAFPKCRYTE